MFSSPMAMPVPCMTESRTVPYLVYWMIFLRPCSPSFESFSKVGTTTVRSCRMIEALM